MEEASLVLLSSFWVAALLGLAMGWIWKPRWASRQVLGSNSELATCRSRASSGQSSVRAYLLNIDASTTSLVRTMFKGCARGKRSQSCPYRVEAITAGDSSAPHVETRKIQEEEEEEGANYNLARSAVGENDLRELYSQFYNKEENGRVPWERMMERSIPGRIMYQAWRRDPEGGGPTEYKSRTVFEDAPIEILKDFYWDDEFRHQWDDMILYTKSLEACTETGAEIAHWIRKFPFFCSDREYIIGRRIYKVGGIFFCITKGVPYSAVPRGTKPRRVDMYSSCWVIQTVQSPRTGQMTGCEVTFFHSEEMGIQRDIAKLGVRQGMWNCVKNVERGFRKYQAHRESDPRLSFSATMAKRVSSLPFFFLSEEDPDRRRHDDHHENHNHQHGGQNAWKWLVVGGAIVLACRLDKRLVGKVVSFGLARKLMKLGTTQL